MSSNGDPSAYHWSHSDEFARAPKKDTPVAGDRIPGEDSENGFAPVYFELGDLPGGGGGSSHLVTYSVDGDLATDTGNHRLPFTSAATLTAVRAMVGTAPTGDDIVVDVNLNGTTIFTTQANRPTIASSANDSGNVTPDVTAVSAGDYLTVDIDQVGSSTPGSNLVVVVEWSNA